MYDVSDIVEFEEVVKDGVVVKWIMVVWWLMWRGMREGRVIQCSGAWAWSVA